MTTKPIDRVVTNITLSRPPWDRIARAVDPAVIIQIGSGDSAALRAELDKADIAILAQVASPQAGAAGG
ncbi:MAG: hypothetical protein GY798_16565 [Hyphomicrobiales bacterium]|nr:hypothetical protein [Hyphomicrobiales bacterium]